MALQLKGGSYGLRQVSSSHKSVLLMKLTDSALRIIESYQDHSSGARSQPSIQFHGNQGVIQIPVPGGDPETQSFTFQVSNLTQSAGVDCLQQIRSGQTGRIECLGSIQQKVTVNATDDSYNMTRKRMTLAKEEEQKTSTKVIKQPGSKIGKVFKKKTGKGRIVDKHHSVGRLSPDTRAPTPPISRLTPTHMLNNRSSSPLTISKDRSASPPGVPGSGRNKTKPMISISSSSSSTQPSGNAQTNNASTSAVAARPLWDRVAHLLAVRSYKYPEIVLRLSRDKPPDKNRLLTILQQVASARNTSGGSVEYCLLRSCYNSIEIEWPGYTEAERQAVKKRLSELSGPSENRKRAYGAALSPIEPNSDSHQDQYSNPTTKKQRVSHYKKPSPGRPAQVSGPPSPPEPDRPKSMSPATTSSGISFGTTRLPSRDAPADNRSNAKNQGSRREVPGEHPDRMEDHSHSSSSAKHSSESASQRQSPVKPSKSERHQNQQKNAVADDVSTKNDDFMTKYTQISSVEQRDSYKRDFYAEYQEYLSHYSNVAAVSGRFAELQRKLNEHKKGSEEYKAISRQVIHEYKKTKKNDAYHHDRARMQFLHHKLQHIKGLVNEFDRHKIANRSENDPGLCMQTKTATRVA